MAVSKRCHYKPFVSTSKTLQAPLQPILCDMLNWYHLARILVSGAFTFLAPNKHNTINSIRTKSCMTVQQLYYRQSTEGPNKEWYGNNLFDITEIHKTLL